MQRFLSNYKIVVVLVFLCHYCSVIPVVNCEEILFADDDSVEDYARNTSNTLFNRFNDDDDDEFPTETQSAQCTITAGEVRASAQASTSKKLEGVCGSKEMRKSFELLEAKLLKELYMMKLMIAQLQYPRVNIVPNYLNSMLDSNPKQIVPDLRPPAVSNYNFAPPTTTVKPTTSASNTDEPGILFPSDLENRFDEGASSVEPELIPIGQGLEMKTMESSQPSRKPKPHTGPRDFEVHRFNNTIISSDDTQIFTYFWIIEHLSQKLKSTLPEITSPIFTISGLHLRVRVLLNHLNRDLLYMKIEAVPHETVLREKSPNIILKSGNMFREIETKKLFRHKIVIMDQDNKSQTDMISQEFFNTNSGFMIPTSAITSSSYSKDDGILIKVIIYL